MKLASFEAIARVLTQAGVRFLVVGGVAVATHGYLRVTRDVDLVVQLQPENIIAALKALQTLGYQPRVPITPEQFADPSVRDSWIAGKQMLVLSLFSDLHRETPVDVFVREPFDFDAEFAKAHIESLGEVRVPFVTLQTLIQMKMATGRQQDLIDAEQLRLRGDVK
jgi:predicted nucleotidyltransferase